LRRPVLALTGALVGALVVFDLVPALLHRPALASTPETRFDATLALGFPAEGDRSPTPIHREWGNGRSPRVRCGGSSDPERGGTADSAVVEPDAMADLSLLRSNRIVPEREARNMVENRERLGTILRECGRSSAPRMRAQAHVTLAAWLALQISLRYVFEAAPRRGCRGGSAMSPAPDGSTCC